MINGFDLTTLSVWSVLMPICVALIFYKTLAKPARVLLLLLLISGMTDAINYYLFERQLSNLIVMNVYTIIELGLFSLFYSFNLVLYSHKKLVSISLLVIFVITIFLTITNDFNSKLNSFTLGLESLTIIAMSLIYFDVMLTGMRHEKIWNDPYFWINSAILFYFSGSFFVFIFIDFVNINSGFDLWTIHSLVRLIFNIILVIGFWKARKTLI